MALVTKSTRASVETGSAQRAPQVIGIAGADIALAAACYIVSTGKIEMTDGTAADVKAKFAGFAARDAKAGEPVTLYGLGSIWHYLDVAATPGTIYYIAATAGRLDTAASTGDSVGVVQVMPDGKTIRVTRNI